MSNHSLSPMAPNDLEDRRANMFMTVNRSAMEQYKLSLENYSNTTLNLILEEIWKEHQDKVDDQSPTGVDNFCGPIDDLIQKHMNRQANQWKSNLRLFSGSPDIIQAVETTQCRNCIAKEDSFDQLRAFITSSSINDLKQFNLPVHVVNSKLHSEIPEHNHAKYSEPCGSSAFEQRNIFSAQTKNVFSPQSITTELNVANANRDVQKVKSVFKTAREELISSNPAVKRSLGAVRKTQSKFVSPMMTESKEETELQSEESDERLKHIDPKMVALIQSEIIDNGTPIKWEDIAGLQTAKSVIQEAVVWPLLRPDIFTGLRRPPKGVLLFGPPGTGKTLIGKCVASQCRATFFNISASSLTSKWIGDGEKMVRALFAVARCHQPAVVFVDEIDSLLMQRSDAEHEATRRIKTEFLVQFDGAGTGEEDRVLVIGATNRPQELDEAARRRFVKRLYIPLPDCEARKQIVSNLMRTERHELGASELEEVGALSDGYSGADVRSLCSEAAMGPIRSLPLSQITNVQSNQVRAVSIDDFRSALQRVRPSVSPGDLAQYAQWNSTYGFGQ